MKRKIISWLLAIACCISLLPSNLVLATEDTGETYPSTTTVAYFTNLADYPQSGSYAQAVTVTGAAFTEVGGKTRWDYGLIIIEPKDGYTFDKAWYPSVGYQQNEYNESNSKKFEVSNVGNVLKELGTIDANRPSIINEAIKGKDECMAIKVDSVLFNNIIRKTICVDFRQTNTGKIVSQRFYINSNEPSLKTKEVTINTQFDLFDYDIFKGSELKREDFIIDSYKNAGFTNLSIKDILQEDTTVIGKYKISEIGKYNFTLRNTKNGIRYFININITDKDVPLKEASISVSDHAIINYNNLSYGMMTVQPKNKEDFLMKEVDFSFNLPEGAVIDWASTKINNIPKALKVNKEEEPLTMSVWTGKMSENVNICPFITEENGKQKLSIAAKGTDDGESCGLKIYITFDIKYNNKKYNYMISFIPNDYVSFMGGRTYFVDPYRNRNIFEFLSVRGSNKDEIEQNKQRFLDNIANGTYDLTMSGVSNESSLNLADGNIHFNSSGNKGLYIYDKKLKTLVNGWSLQIVLQNITILAEEPVDLKEYEKFLDTGSYKVDPPKGNICYDSTSNSIYPNSENAEGVVDIKSSSDNRLLAEFIVRFGSKETREYNLKNAIAKMSKDGGKSVFFSMENDDKAEISADVLNALIASTNATKESEGNRLVITLKSSSGNKVDWDFNSANMKNNVKKNIVLNVQVGDKVENTGINKILEEAKETGLKVGFWDNGELPGETQVHLYLSDEEAAILERNAYGKTKISDEDTNNIYLYYYNPSTQRLVKERSNLYINSTPNNKKYISIPVTHNSDFVLSTASDLDKNTSSSSGIILGGGTSIVYTPAPTATVAPTAIPTATPTVAPTPTPAPTATVVPTAVPTITPEQTTAPTVAPTTEPTVTPVPTVTPSVKNKVKKVKAVKKKVTIQKNKKVNVNFKVTATNNTKVVKDKVKVTVKNKKVAKVMKTKVKVGKAIVTVKGLKKGKTILKVNIGGKTAKTTLKIQ